MVSTKLEHTDEKERQALQNGQKSEAKIVSGLDRTKNAKPLGEQSRAVRRQELMVVLGNVGTLSMGMALGLPTVTKKQMTDVDELVHLSESEFSWFASLNTLSCPLGGLLSALLLDRFGRKFCMYTMNIVALTAWMLMASAIENDRDIVYSQLLLSRFFIGLATGLASAPVGVYSAEISVPKIRGRLLLGTSLGTALGITIIYVIGYFIRDDWHLIAMICCGYQVVAVLCIVPLPESPSWLSSKKRIVEAKRSLNYFRGLDKSSVITHPHVLAEFNLLQKSIQLAEGEKKPSFFKLVRLPEVYKPLLILMGLFSFQQLTGIFVVIVYAVQIAAKAGVSIDPFVCAVFVGLARFITTCFMSIILEKWGRRRAGMLSAIGMSICMFLLATHDWCDLLQKIPFLPAIALVCFILISTLGLYTLPFVMVSELFPQKVRGPASGITVAVGMFFAFVCIKTYPSMEANIGNSFCFLAYGIAAVLALVFVYFALPETRGRTLLEIEEHFRGSSKLSQKRADVEMQQDFLIK